MSPPDRRECKRCHNKDRIKTTVRFRPSLTGMYLALLLAVFMFPFLSGADDTPIRLAVLPEDSAAESRSLADLLTVRLSKTEGLEVVERAEIDRVLAEHELTAMGLIEPASRVRLGTFLRAQGLVFVKYDAVSTHWITRLVETRHGFLAGIFTTPGGDGALDPVAQQITGDIASIKSKLSLDIHEQTLVSMLGFNSVVKALRQSQPYSRDIAQVEQPFVVRLTEELTRMPDVLVVERRKISALHDESSLLAELPRFNAAGLLIDGELVYTPGDRMPEVDNPVTFNVRIRDGLLRETLRIVENGSLDELDALIERTARSARNAIKDMTQIPRHEDPVREAEALLGLAKRHDLVWAAEAAYALMPDDAETLNELLRILSNTILRQMVGASYVDYVRLADRLANMAQLCTDDGIPLLPHLFYLPRPKGKSWLRHNLNNAYMRHEPEIRGILTPFNDLMKREIYDMPSADRYPFLLAWMEFLHPNRERRLEIMKSLLQEIANDSLMQDAPREQMIATVIAHGDWPIDILRGFANSSDPVARYFANIRLMRFYFTPHTRRPYALAALNEIDSVLERPHLFMSYSRDRAIVTGVGGFSESIQRLIFVLPEKEAHLVRRVFTTMNRLRQNVDLPGLHALDPVFYLKRMPDSDALAWIKDTISELQPILDTRGTRNVHRHHYLACRIADSLQEYHHQIAKTTPSVAPDPVIDPTVQRRLLLSPDGHGNAWTLDLPGDLADDWKNATIYPQTLLIEEDTLWISIGNYAFGARHRTFSGLLEFDLSRKQIRSLQYGFLRGGFNYSSRRADTVAIFGPKEARTTKTILPIFRWNDRIVLPQYGIGVLLYPADIAPGITGLQNVRLINAGNHGLKNNHLFFAAGLKDDLYVVLGDTAEIRQYFMRWRSSTERASLIWDTKQDLPPEGIAGDFIDRIDGLYADTEQGKLIVEERDFVKKQMIAGVWRYENYKVFEFDPKNETWQRLDADFNPEPRIAPKCPTTINVWPDGERRYFDAVNWGEGTLAITGFGPDCESDHDK